MDIKQLRICHPEPCVRDLKKTRMIEILRFAQKRSSPPEGAKGNDKVNGFFIILSCWSEATKSGGFDNADSEWSHVAWAMLMPCGSRKGGIVKGSLKNRGPVMLERSEASKERKRKRFFRAKPSTTRLIPSK